MKRQDQTFEEFVGDVREEMYQVEPENHHEHREMNESGWPDGHYYRRNWGFDLVLSAVAIVAFLFFSRDCSRACASGFR